MVRPRTRVWGIGPRDCHSRAVRGIGDVNIHPAAQTHRPPVSCGTAGALAAQSTPRLPWFAGRRRKNNSFFFVDATVCLFAPTRFASCCGQYFMMSLHCCDALSVTGSVQDVDASRAHLTLSRLPCNLRSALQADQPCLIECVPTVWKRLRFGEAAKSQ